MIGTPEEISLYLWSLDKNKRYEILEHKEKRSLNANSYAWKLLSKIAEKLKTSKEDIYLLMLERYGQSDVVSVSSDVDVKPYFKYYKELGKSTLNGKEFTHYKCFKGSSNYNTKEMSILIDGIVSECEDLGIETLTPHELEMLKGAWANE